MRVAALALSLTVVSAEAAEIPMRFRGIWNNTASKASCPVEGQQRPGTDDPLTTITSTSIRFRQTSCNVLAVSAIAQADVVVVAFSCDGDDQDAQAKELWKLSVVKGTPVLLVSDLNRPFLSIYTKCD